MRSKVENKNRNCEFHGDYIGRDKITNIVMLQDIEREFVVTHNANIRSVAYFTGRKAELQELRQRIDAKQKAVLVSGMGGIGKTQICKKLFEEYLSRHDVGEKDFFRHIGYIEYSGTMDSSLQKCLKYMQQDNPEQNREAAWKELEYLASDGKLLLFVDNVDKTIREDAGLQRLSQIPGAVILTSRQESFSDEFENYRVGFLSLEQCKEIYGKICFENNGGEIKEEEVENLEYIIEELAGRHTITVELLAHLAYTKHWSVKKLRKELRRKGFCLEFPKNGEVINIQKSYEALYDLSKLTKAEQNIMEAFSVFPYIPLSVETCNQWLLADAGAEEDDNILAGLWQKGWLQYEEDQEGYALHPVFAQFIYEKCKPRVEEHYGLIKACKECIKIPQNGSILECRIYLPFAESIAEKLELVVVTDAFMTAFIDFLQNTAEYKNAEKLYEKIFRRIKKLQNFFFLKHEDYIVEKAVLIGDELAFIKELASALQDTAEYKKAEELYEKLLQMAERSLGREDVLTAKFYSDLAAVYENQGKYEKAKELYEKCLRIVEQLYGEENPNTAVVYIKLAGVYGYQGEYEKARELYEKGLRIAEQQLGEEHPVTVTDYHNLAAIYALQGEYEKARELFEKSLRIRIRISGEEDTNIAICYCNLAEVYEIQGEHGKAKELYEKGLQIMKRLLGGEHPDLAKGYGKIAGIYAEQGEYAKAEELYKKNLAIVERLLGEEHPDTATCCHGFANVYVKQGKYAKAEKLYERSLRIRERVLGEEHPDTVACYNGLAEVYEERGKYVKAEELYEKSLRVTERLSGEDHRSIAALCGSLATIHMKRGKYGKAKELYKKSIRITEQMLGEEYSITSAVYYHNLAVMCEQQKEYETAVAYRLKAYSILLVKKRIVFQYTQRVYEDLKTVYSEWQPKGNFDQWLAEALKKQFASEQQYDKQGQ